MIKNPSFIVKTFSVHYIKIGAHSKIMIVNHIIHTVSVEEGQIKNQILFSIHEFKKINASK